MKVRDLPGNSLLDGNKKIKLKKQKINKTINGTQRSSLQTKKKLKLAAKRTLLEGSVNGKHNASVLSKSNKKLKIKDKSKNGFNLKEAANFKVKKKDKMNNKEVSGLKSGKKTLIKKLQKKGNDDSDESLNEEDDENLDEDNKDFVGSDNEDLNSSDIEDSDDLGDSDKEDPILTHKQQLQKLKDTDKEFYKYLQENDKELLNFDDSDHDSEDDEANEKYHKGPESLEVASDESDFEPDDDTPSNVKGRSNVVTLKMVAKWQEDLQTDRSNKTLREVVEAFHAALLRVSSDEKNTPQIYIIDGAPVFNAVVRLCVIELPRALRLILKISPGAKVLPQRCKSWCKIQAILKTYFTDLNKLSGVTSPSMLSVLLKHIHQMVPFIVCFADIAQRTLRRMVELWCSNEDVVRVLSFLCALKIVNNRRSLLRPAIKMMYLNFVRNAKFVSPNTLPSINFMRQSLAEMLALDDTVTYHQGFLYIRQLAIHLRNAITMNKKESIQTVHNWQFISSLHLWAELLGMVPPSSPLRSLLYPLVQIIFGTIKLVSSAQFYPLRFYCCKILISLSEKSGVFIPVLPFLLEILRDFDFNRKHKNVSMKPLDLTFLLRCSKSQMSENGFKDAIIENVHNLLLEYLATECFRISFPDTLVPAVIQMKNFLKVCKVSNYCKKIKSILDKIVENSKFIEAERKKVTIKLDDVDGVEAIEAGLKAKGTPFLTFYNSWNKLHLQQQAKKVTDNVSLGDFKLPVIYKFDKKRSRDQAESVAPAELFPSDDDDDDNFNFGDDSDDEPKPKKQKAKKESKPPKVQKAQKAGKVQKPKKVNIEEKQMEYEDDSEIDNGEDIVQDLNLSDFE